MVEMRGLYLAGRLLTFNITWLTQWEIQVYYIIDSIISKLGNATRLQIWSWEIEKNVWSLTSNFYPAAYITNAFPRGWRRPVAVCGGGQRTPCNSWHPRLNSVSSVLLYIHTQGRKIPFEESKESPVTSTGTFIVYGSRKVRVFKELSGFSHFHSLYVDLFFYICIYACTYIYLSIYQSINLTIYLFIYSYYIHTHIQCTHTHIHTHSI